MRERMRGIMGLFLCFRYRTSKVDEVWSVLERDDYNRATTF
jgi:hypothetical protein